MNFRTVNGKKVSPIIHTRNVVKNEPHVEIHIGSDSQRVGSEIIYVTAIAYRYPFRGVHYIYWKEIFPPIKDD